MDISVLIPTFNRRDILRRSLLLYNAQQGMDGRFEVLVVDDGSTDGTGPMVEALRPQLAFPLRYFALPGNAGPSAARNRAMPEAAGRILVFTGDDILPARDLLLQHWTWHTERHPGDHVGVLGRVEWADDLAPTPFMRWLDQAGAQFAYGRIRHGDAVDYGFLYTSNVSVKRGFLAAAGERFDERLRFCEDSEWGLRLARKGFELRYNADALGKHLHATTLDSSLRRMAALGAALPVLRGVSPENFARITQGMTGDRRRVRSLLLRAALHPAMARLIYTPLARLCERRLVADRLFAACHAAHLLKGLRDAERRVT